MIIERLVMKPLYSRPLDAILATWGLGIIIGQVITLAFGREVQFVQSPVTGAVDLLGASYSEYRLLLVLVAIAIAIGLALLLNGTRLGLVTRAVIMNENLARGLGINSGLVRFVTFSLGAGLASLAGALDHAAVERRSEHGRALADQRVHAGDGVRRVAGQPGCGLPGARAARRYWSVPGAIPFWAG